MKSYYTFKKGAILLVFLLFACLNVKANATAVWSIICPDDVTVDCNDELWDLSIYGNATYHDHTGYHSAGTPSVHYYLNSCNSGYITRTWTVEDPYWNLHTCTQTITVGGGGFNSSSITWPAMATLEGCNPNTHPDITGKPTWVPSECSMVGYSYEDKLYTVTASCKKILRKWTIIDWCQNSSYSNQWTYTQTIKIVENTPPTFECIKDITVTANDCKWGKVTANPLVLDPATCGGKYEITNNSIYAKEKGADLSGNYPVGVTKVIYTVKYGCGDKKTCTVNVTVKSKAPVAVCIGSLSVALMGLDTDHDGANDQGMVQLWAKDLDWKSYSTCGYQPLRFSFSPDPTQMSKVFTCDDVGKKKVKMYVTDTKGGQSYCEVDLWVQNNGANIQNCEPQPTPPPSASRYAVSGKIQTVYEQGIKDINLELFIPNELYKYTYKYDTVTVSVRDSFKSQSGAWIKYFKDEEKIVSIKDSTLQLDKVFKKKTDDKGLYAFDTVMNKSNNYMLKCLTYTDDLKNIDKNDVDILTSYLLGNEVFTQSWQYIAADVDKNKIIDINDLNLLINFVKGDINKFTDENYALLLWNDEMNHAKKEILLKQKNWTQFENVATDLKDINFLAIQMGDINKEVHTGNVIEELASNRSKEETEIAVYPNPFSDKLIISIPSAYEQKANFNLLDITGKLIDQKEYNLTKGSNILEYDSQILGMKPGLYFYTFYYGETKSSGKLIKI